MAAYILTVIASIPAGASMLSITGGYLFGYFFGTLFVIFAATVGACVIFLAVRMAIGDWLISKAKGSVAKIAAGFHENAFSYLLFLRLVPVFPFFLINIATGLTKVRFRTFVAATFLGIIPGSFIYVSIGTGIGKVIESTSTPDVSSLVEPHLILPIVALGLLTLVPLLYKKYKKVKNDRKNP